MQNLSKPDDKRFTRQLLWDAVKLIAILGVCCFIILLGGIKIFLSH